MIKIAAIVFLMCGVIFSYIYAQDAAINTAIEPVTATENSLDSGVAVETKASSDASVSSEAPSDTTSTEGLSVTRPGNVSLDFREADIRNVLRILSYKSGVNIVAGPEVSGLVTIQLTDVPWEQALQVVLETQGYAYDRKGNIILVTTIENLKKRREDALLLAEQEPLVTKTFILNYAKAGDVIESIEKMRTPRGSINFDERTNTIIMRDTESNIKLISEVIPTLDATTPQVLIESKIVETTLSDTDKLGIDWVAKATTTGSKRPTIYPFTPNSDSKYLVDNIPAAASSFFSYGTLDFSTVSAVFEMLQSRADTNILSNPRIVTLDNQKASITIGTQYPIPTYTYNEEQAKLQVSGWEYKDIGIIFDVTPQVNNAGFVTLSIQPRITEILDFVTVENTSLPRLSNESATTQVMIKDGDTLVIAGLIKDKDTTTTKKLPILGDIPLLGLIFQKIEKTQSKTDLLIFLTPHIITVDMSAVDNGGG